MRFDIITIFPKIFDSYFSESILKRAQAKDLVEINVFNLRDFAYDRHKTVDDRPYGGGFGMVLMAEPIIKAVKAIKKKKDSKVILLSAKGKKFDQKMAKKFSKSDQIIIICGRYEGIDERINFIADEEISIGDYILTGGELAAMVMVDSVARLIPGVIAEGSLEEESFSKDLPAGKAGKYLEYPHYTRPEEVVIGGKKRKVPQVLLSGDHKKIEEWRKKNSKTF